MHLTSDQPRHLREDRTIEDVRLPAHLRWPMLAMLVAIFLFGGERPIWENPFDIDRAIWLSYAPIPILVAAGLWWSKRLSAATLFLNTLEIVLTKFGLTYMIAMTAWALSSDPPNEPGPTSEHHVVVDMPEEAPDPTPWPTKKVRTIAGRIMDAGASPVNEAFVYVSGGLDDIVFERPSTAAVIDLGGGFASDLIVVRRWQPLKGRSTDGQLHTLFIEAPSMRAVPLLPSGALSDIRVHHLDGVLPMRCSAHRRRAHIAVLHHPFHTYSDEDGRYTLEGVPDLPVEITAWTPDAQATSVDADLTLDR